MDYRHGYGRYEWSSYNVYEGMFFMNFREGYGKLIYSTGDLFIVMKQFKIYRIYAARVPWW